MLASVHTWQSRRARRAAVGAVTVTAEERNALQAQVLQFTKDVDAQEVRESGDRASAIAQNAGMAACRSANLAWDCATMQCVQAPDPQGDTYDCVPGVSFAARDFRTNDLTPFLARWEQFLTSWGAGVGVADFESIKLRFQQLVAAWQVLGFETAAVPPPVNDPDNAFDKATAAAPWVVGGLVVVAALVGLAYLSPALLPLIQRPRASGGDS